MQYLPFFEMKTKYAIVGIFVFVFFTFFVYAGVILYMTWPISEFSVAKSGVFGDSFGALNALFSGMAFAGLIVTVLLQRDEIQRSRIGFERQQFETAFYKLLDLYSKNLREIRIQHENEEEPYEGVDAISFLLKRLRQAVVPYSQNLVSVEARSVYEYEIFNNAKSVLVHQARYLSTLQHLLSLVFRYSADSEEREKYLSIVASQLTSVEFKYLFYSCLVLPREHSLPQMINATNVMRSGFAKFASTRVDKALYERIHEVTLFAESLSSEPPYRKKQISRLKKKLNLNKKQN